MYWQIDRLSQKNLESGIWLCRDWAHSIGNYLQSMKTDRDFEGYDWDFEGEEKRFDQQKCFQAINSCWKERQGVENYEKCSIQRTKGIWRQTDTYVKAERLLAWGRDEDVGAARSISGEGFKMQHTASSCLDQERASWKGKEWNSWRENNDFLQGKQIKI